MSKTPLRLYGFWRSQATFRVRVALNLKGIDYDEVPVDLDAGAQNEPAFRAINPMGGVPALMIEKRAITQSSAILEYIEDMHPSPALLPADPVGRARVRGLAAIAISDTHPLIVPRVKRYLTEEASFSPAAWKAWQTMFFSAGLRGYEARLSSEAETGTYCHGESVSLADICLCGLAAGATTFGISVSDIPTVDRIVAACMNQPAFDRAKANRQSDYPG